MEQKLMGLVDRLVSDVNGMPWNDRGISAPHLKNSLDYFINVFKIDAQDALKQITIKGTKGEPDA